MKTKNNDKLELEIDAKFSKFIAPNQLEIDKRIQRESIAFNQN